MHIGIIGAGRFGMLLQKHLATDHTVTMDDPSGCDLVIFAVPNRYLEQAIQQWKQQIPETAIVMDVGSVKTIPCEILQKQFFKNILGTHPLYGPDSAATSWKGHKVVFCRIHIDDEKYQQVKQLFSSRGVAIYECTPEQHDIMMAKTQALVHFIGRALTGLEPQDIATPDYGHLLKMMEKVTNDTWELFYDMQTLNPYAEPIRKNFVEKIKLLDKDIDDHRVVGTEYYSVPTTKTTVPTLRAQIDAIDEAIVRFVGERFALAKQIGQVKKDSEQPVQDSKRETELFLRMNSLAQQYGVPLEVVIHLYDYLMGESRKIQHLPLTPS